MPTSTQRDRTYMLSVKTDTDPLSIWFFIPENEGIIHMGVNNSQFNLRPSIPEFVWDDAPCSSKRCVLRGIWATQQSDILCEPVSKPVQFISINIVKRTIAIFQLTIANCILMLQHFPPEITASFLRLPQQKSNLDVLLGMKYQVSAAMEEA